MCEEVIFGILGLIEPSLLELGTDASEELEGLAVFENRVSNDIVVRSEVLQVELPFPRTNMAVERHVEVSLTIEDLRRNVSLENNQVFELLAAEGVFPKRQGVVVLEAVEVGSNFGRLSFQLDVRMHGNIEPSFQGTPDQKVLL